MKRAEMRMTEDYARSINMRVKWVKQGGHTVAQLRAA